MRSATRQRHPGDGRLVRLLDGELSGPDERVVRGHLEACAECAVRYRELQDRDRRLTTLLVASAAALEPPAARPPTAGRSSPVGPSRRLRAAAIAALLLAAGLLAPPVRAWVGERVGEVVADVVALLAGPAPPGPEPESTTTVRFDAPGPRLTVRTDRAPAGAILIIERRADDGPAVLELEGTGGVTVLPDGIRLEGGAPDAAYRLSVPAAVDRVDLVPGPDARPASIPVPAAGEIEVRLSRDRRP